MQLLDCEYRLQIMNICEKKIANILTDRLTVLLDGILGRVGRDGGVWVPGIALLLHRQLRPLVLQVPDSSLQTFEQLIIMFVQGASPTPHPFYSRPRFVCKFSREENTEDLRPCPPPPGSHYLISLNQYASFLENVTANQNCGSGSGHFAGSKSGSASRAAGQC
jgi:hypothetical protein